MSKHKDCDWHTLKGADLLSAMHRGRPKKVTNIIEALGESDWLLEKMGVLFSILKEMNKKQADRLIKKIRKVNSGWASFLADLPVDTQETSTEKLSFWVPENIYKAVIKEGRR